MSLAAAHLRAHQHQRQRQSLRQSQSQTTRWPAATSGLRTVPPYGQGKRARRGPSPPTMLRMPLPPVCGHLPPLRSPMIVIVKKDTLFFSCRLCQCADPAICRAVMDGHLAPSPMGVIRDTTEIDTDCATRGLWRWRGWESGARQGVDDLSARRPRPRPTKISLSLLRLPPPIGWRVLSVAPAETKAAEHTIPLLEHPPRYSFVNKACQCIYCASNRSMALQSAAY